MADPFPSRPRPTRAAASGDLAAEVADLLHGVNRRIRRSAMDELEPLGITSAEVRALRTLAGRGEPSRMSELAEVLGIARRSATSVVDALESAGFVVRQVDPHDRRAIDVVLTDAGRQAMSAVRARRRAVATRVLGELTAEELEALRSVLSRLSG